MSINLRCRRIGRKRTGMVGMGRTRASCDYGAKFASASTVDGGRMSDETALRLVVPKMRDKVYLLKEICNTGRTIHFQ